MGLLAAGAGSDDPDWQRAKSWFQKAADSGFAEAQYNLAVLYAEGRGVEKNAVAAGEYFLKAAMQGMADAALEYGVMVFRGDGVEKNEEIGAQWLLVAAQRGNVIAQNRVARVLAAGRGLKSDAVEAAKWHVLASKGGRSDNWLDEFVSRLTDAERAEAKKRADAWTTLHAAEIKEATQKASSGG
jgi:TPR repeat protein